MKKDKGEIVPVDQATVVDSLRPNHQDKLRAIELNIRGRLVVIKKNIFVIGQLLSAAREIIGDDGTYQQWIRETFADELPKSTAALYKHIYDRFNTQPSMILYLPVSILLRLGQMEFPETVLKLFEEDPEGYGKLNQKKFKKAYDNYKQGRITEYEFWAQTKGCIDKAFELLTDRNQKKKFDLVVAQVRSGFSKIGTGISLVGKLKTAALPLDLRDFYNKQFDKQISKLKKMREEFNQALDMQHSRDISEADKNKAVDV